MKIGAQLFTLRTYTQTPEDLDYTLSQVAQMGYETVQVSAIGPMPPETVRALWNSQVAAQRLYACIAAEIAGQELPEYEEGPLSRDLICL